jgi:hypothetical protein
VTMGSHEEALCAIDGLDSRFTWDGMDSPMVVKWMDAALQRRRREQHLASIRQSSGSAAAGAGVHSLPLALGTGVCGSVCGEKGGNHVCVVGLHGTPGQ